MPEKSIALVKQDSAVAFRTWRDMSCFLEMYFLSARLAGQSASGCHLTGFVGKRLFCCLTQGMQRIAGQFQHSRE
jgi:hypothetical protein